MKDILIPLITLLVGLVIAFPAGIAYRRKVAEAELGSAEEEAKRVLSDAIKTAESKKKEALVEAKDEIFKLRSDADREIKDRRNEVTRQERRILQREESLDKKTENLEKKEEQLSQKIREAEDRLADAEAVKTYTHAYQAAYVRAYHSLKAARQVELDAVTAVGKAFDADRARRLVRGIIQRELRESGKQTGKTTRRFIGSITHKGYIWRFDSVEALCPRVYEFADSWELAGESLAAIHGAAAERGWDTIACMAPEEPDRLEHLLIPGLGLAFVTSRPGMDYGRKPYRRVRLDAMTEPENKARLRFQTRMAALLREEGVAALREAKANHDRLEAVYNPYVDFDGVRTLAALEAGRILSWLG